MPTRISAQELDRIRNTLFHAGELVALESLVGTALIPTHVLAVLHRLPQIIERIRQLIVAIEHVGQSLLQTEAKVLGGLESLRIGGPEVLALAVSPVAAISTVGGVWLQPEAPRTVLAPGTTNGLIAELAGVCELPQPTIRVDRYDGPDGHRFVVFVPGTKAFLGGPLDMRTNLLELAGLRSPVEQAVEKALAASGASVGDRVTVVGHSLGGMVGVSLAERSQKGDVPYFVDQVLQIGAPVGNQPPLEGVKLLSVEGRVDVIPDLDGLEGPNWPGSEVVSLDQPGVNLVRNHEIEGYLADVRAAEAAGKLPTDWQTIGQSIAGPGVSRQFEFGLSEIAWKTVFGR